MGEAGRVYLRWSFVLYYFDLPASAVDQVHAADAMEFLELVRYLAQRGSADGT